VGPTSRIDQPTQRCLVYSGPAGPGYFRSALGSAAHGRADRGFASAACDRTWRRSLFDSLLEFQLLRKALQIEQQILDDLVTLFTIFAHHFGHDACQLSRHVRKEMRQWRWISLQNRGERV